MFVCHVTTNPFFTPTQYGADDACKLLGTSFQWTGSKDSIVAEMVNAINTAVSGQADGIAVAVVDKTAFRGPIDSALERRDPGRVVQRRRRPRRCRQQPAGLHRTGPLRLRVRTWASAH